MAGSEGEFFSVLDIFNNVVAQSIPYCGVCLRSGPSVKLVTPRNLTELITALGLRIFQPVSSTIPHACVMCERQAAGALRAHAALRCAARVHALFSELRRANSIIVRKVHQDQTYRASQTCDELLKEVRRRTRLVQTEVLLVDSTGVCCGGHHTQSQLGVIGKQPSRKIDTSSLGPIETVVLDDDDDPLSVTSVTPPALTGVPLLQLTPLVSLYNGSNVLYLQNPVQENNLLINDNINNVNNKEEDVVVVIENNCSVKNVGNNVDKILQDKADELDGRKRARFGGPRPTGSQGSTGEPRPTGDPRRTGGPEPEAQHTYVVNIDDVTDMINEQNKKLGVIGKQPSRKIDTSSLGPIETVVLDDDDDPLSVTSVTPPALTGVPLLQLTPLVSLYNGSNVLYLQNPVQENNLLINDNINNVNNKEEDVIENNCSVKNVGNNVDKILQDKADELDGRKRARFGGPRPTGSRGSTGEPRPTGDPRRTGRPEPEAQHTYVINIDDVTDMINEQNKKEQKKMELERQNLPRLASAPEPAAGQPATPARRPAAGARRIDWEDKIPMDVISFMDATDPNAAELIVPDQTEKQRGAKRGSEAPPAGPGPPVIDLC